MNSIDSIEFTDYDKITDTLMWLSDNTVLNFVTILNKKNKFGERKFFQYETMYGEDKSTNKPLRSIKRNMDFYFVIENRDVFGGGIVLRPQDVYTFLMFVEQKVLPWYYGTPKQQAFRIINGELVFNNFEPVVWAQSENAFIEFSPYIFTFEDNTSSQYIKMNIRSTNEILMSIDKFMGFLQLLKSDMYACACTNVNYAKTQPYGINVYNAKGLGGGRGRDPVGSDWNMNYSGNSAKSFLDNVKKKE